MALNDGDARDALASLGLSQTDDNVNQLLVFAEALDTYEHRTPKYGQNWKRYGWLSNLSDILRKSDRLWSMYWTGKMNPMEGGLDDAIDLLNYIAFFIRNAQDGNERGGVR